MADIEPYVPGPVPLTLEDIARYVDYELNQIAALLGGSTGFALDADYGPWTGEWSWYAGTVQPDPPGPTVTPIKFTVDGVPFEFIEYKYADLIDLDLVIPGVPPTIINGNVLSVRYDRPVNAPNPALYSVIVGDSDLALRLESTAFGIDCGASLIFGDTDTGIKYRNQSSLPQSAVLLPNDITTGLTRFDTYSDTQLGNPPGSGSSYIPTQTIHPDNPNDPGVGIEFSYQWIFTSNQDYDAATYPKSDPSIVVRSGAPSAANGGRGEWNGDWLNVVVADLNPLPAGAGDDPRYNGSTLQYRQDAAFPDGGRFQVVEPAIAGMYIDYSNPPPASVSNGNPVLFINGIGYAANSSAPTPTASFDVSTGELIFAEPGVYQLGAAITMDVGSGNDAALLLERSPDGVVWALVPGLATAASTSNQNDVANFSITGYFVITDPGGSRLRLRFDTNGGAAPTIAGQFWARRDFAA